LELTTWAFSTPTSGETVEARSVLEEKDSTDWGKLSPLLEQASNNLWFLVIVLAICSWGARLVYKALFDAAGDSASVWKLGFGVGDQALFDAADTSLGFRLCLWTLNL
jgi:hypothetical protein